MQQRSNELDHPILNAEPVADSPDLPGAQIVPDTSPKPGINQLPTSERAPVLANESINPSTRDKLFEVALADRSLRSIERLGKGGQGQSYLLVDDAGNKFKAKILDNVPMRVLYCPENELHAYLPEARYLSKVTVPGAAKFLGAHSIEDADLRRFVVVVSEYVEGETLEAKLSQLEPGRGLSVSETFNLLIKLSTVLAKLHSETHNGLGYRIVHSDIKPANIVLSDSGDPTLIDFGCVRAVTPGETEQVSSETSSMHSFCRGRSPLEQYFGKRIPASDIYALGVTAIECLLGKIPKELEQAPRDYRTFTVKPSHTIPQPLAAILTKMVALRSEDRYQNGQELLAALRQAEEAILTAADTQKVIAQTGTDLSPSPGPLAIEKSAGLIVKNLGSLLTGWQELWSGLTDFFNRRAQITRAHGFKQVKAPDGTAAIAVKITRPNGEQVTCLLSEGARDKKNQDLADYGKNELQGSALLPHADFKAVAERLFYAIRGRRLNRLDWGPYVLRTRDAALKQAFRIVTEVVRRDGGESHVWFDLDRRNTVVGMKVSDLYRDIGNGRDYAALYRASPTGPS